MADPGLFNVSRTAFWAWILSLTLVLALLSWWVGLYQPPEELPDTQQPLLDDQAADPVEYTLLGQILVFGCAQFMVANFIYWPALYVYRRLRRPAASSAR